MKFACKFIPWYLHYVDKLTSKKYAKTINLLCAGNTVFVKYQAQGGGNPNAPLRTPLLNINYQPSKLAYQRKIQATLRYSSL